MSEEAVHPRTWVDLAVESAPRLRAAGVRRLKLGDFEMELDGVPAPATAEEAQALEKHIETLATRVMRGPLDDPATFGRSEPGARAPGYGRAEDENAEDED